MGAPRQKPPQPVTPGRVETWTWIDGSCTRVAHLDISDRDTVEITHELLEQLLTRAGWQKAATPSSA